jgi:hypothetical protein
VFTRGSSGWVSTCGLFLLAISTGCIPRELGPQVVSATDNLKQGLNALGEGVGKIKDIDPIALNRVLTENTQLATQLRELQSKISSYGPKAGVVNVTSTNRIFVVVQGYQGTVRLDAWVDKADNWIVQNVLLQSASPKLAMEFKTAESEIGAEAKRIWELVTHKPFDGHMWSCAQNHQSHPLDVRADAAFRFAARIESLRREIDTKYTQAVSAALDAFVKGPFLLPTVSLTSPQSVDTRLRLKSGDHAIYVKVTPAGAPNEKWFVEFKTFITASDGTQQQISLTRIDSETVSSRRGPDGAVEVARFFAEVAN